MDTTKFQAALARAAAKSNIDISDLKFEGVTTDATWGDRVGLVFFGSTPEVNARAAAFFETWMRKQPRKSSYDAQDALRPEGAFHYVRYTNGAKGWHRGAPKSQVGDVACTLSDGFKVAVEEVRAGVAVSTTYYPCAD